MAQEPAWLSQSSKVDSDSWLDQVSKPVEPSQAKKDLPLIDITDIASSLGETVTSLPTTVTASLGQMYEGTMNPWEKGAASIERQKEMRDVQREAEKAQAEAEASGEASVFSRAIRSGIPSYGFTGAIVPPSLVAGGVASLATAAATRSPVAAQRAGMAAGTAASGYAAYRMAASQFLDDARERIDNFFLEKEGRLPNKQEQDEAYQELLPLAQEMGMAEALPEAFGNLALAGAGKYIYRILGGKTGVQQLASGALSKVKGMNALKAVGAGAAGAGTEVGTEAVTDVLQESPYKKLEKGIMQGQPVEAVEIPPFTLERFKQGVERVAEPTLATTAMMGLVGVAGGMAYRGLTRQSFEESEFRDKMTKQAESAEKQLSSPDITPAQRKFLADKVEESNAALKALDEGRSSDVEKYFNVRFTKAEEPSMPLPDEIVIAADNLKATENVPFTDVSGKTTTAIIKQNNQIAPQPTIQPEQAAEEVESLSNEELTKRANSYRRFLAANPGYVGVEKDLMALEAELQRRQTTPTANQANFEARNQNMLPDTDDFGGKFEKPLRIDPNSYTNSNGIETVNYINPNNGLVDVYISAFGNNDFIAYMRHYDENGAPTNRWTSKLERRTTKDGATKAMLRELQSRLPKDHQYTEDVSVSTDGLRFFTNQLQQGYEVARNPDGTPQTTEVAISGESITNDLPISVDPNGKFENIRVSNPKEFAKVQEHLAKMLEKFGVGLNKSNVRWENGTVFIDLPVLNKKSQTDKVVEKDQVTTETPSLPETGPPVVDQEAPAVTTVQAASIESIELPTDSSDAIKGIVKRHDSLFKNLRNAGVDVRLSRPSEAAETKGVFWVNETDEGKLELVLDEKNAEKTEAVGLTDQAIFHETVHAAQALFDRDNQFLSTQADKVFDPNSSEFDQELDGFMANEVPSWSKIRGTRNAKYEAVRALLEAKHLNKTSRSFRPGMPFVRYLSQFIEWAKANVFSFGTAKNKKFSLYVTKIDRLLNSILSAAPIQPVETQEDAAPEIPLEESIRQEPQDRVESREAEEAGVGDQLLSPAPSEEKVARQDVTYLEEPSEFTRKAFKYGVPGSGVAEGFLSYDDIYVVDPSKLPPNAIVGSDFQSYVYPRGDKWMEVFMDLDGVVKTSPVVRDEFKSSINARKPITPKGTPTPATEGMVTPGGVATERDLTNLEQMTPDEALETLLQRIEMLDDRRAELKNQNTFSRGKNTKKEKEARAAREDELARIKDEMLSLSDVSDQIREASTASKRRDAIPREYIDKNNLAIPQGYVKQGELYVFQPQTTKAAAEGMVTPGGVATERGIKPQKVGNVAAIPTPEEEARWKAVDDFTAPYVASLSDDSLDALGSKVGVKRNGVADDAYRAKILGNTHPDDLLDAIPDAIPQTTRAAAETQTPESVGRGLGGSRGASSSLEGGRSSELPKVSPETESESSGNLSTAEAAMSYLMDDLTDAQKAKWTPEMFAAAQAYFDGGGKDFESLQKVVKHPSVVLQAYLKADKVASEEQARIDKAQRATDAEIAKAEREEKKLEAEMLKREEMRSKAIDSIIGAAEKKKRKFGQVTNSDAIAAVAMLVSSKDVPGVLTTWTGTKEDFLRDPANRMADPEIYARIKAGELVEGFFNKGRAYVFLDGIGVSEADMLRGEQIGVSAQIAAVRRVLLHESLVHRGIHGLPLRHRRLILNWVRQNSTPQELDELASLYTEYANWRNSDYEFEALAEELLAKKVDSLTEIPKDGPMAKLMDILRQIWDFIVGYKREPTLSDLKSVVKLLKSGAEALANDRLKDGGEVKLSIRAFHGTPHKVDKFSLSKIGTGEGAQAYGWGLYFAENREVGEQYKKQLSSKYPVSHSGVIEENGKYLAWVKPTDGRDVQVIHTDATQKGAKNALKKYMADKRGNLYTVELLPDEDQFLDWDKPLSEQSEKVKAALADVGESPGDIQRAIDFLTPKISMEGRQAGLAQKQIDQLKVRLGNVNLSSGAQFYNRLGEAPAASAILAKAGIPGIRYLDGGSRGAGDGTRNYVIFDENLVRILEENGQSLVPPEGSDIRFSRPQFSSDTSAALTAGSEAARSSIYSERDMDIREAIRRAYEAMPKTSSVAVPIGELFAKTEELMPGVKQEEFSLVLQDLFEDNGAVLQEGDVVEPLTENDRRYLALAEDEDANREELQRMVDEAAKAAGFNVGPVWHGTTRQFNVFRASKMGELGPGIYTTTDEDMATSTYTIERQSTDGGSPHVKKLHLSLSNPVFVPSGKEAYEVLSESGWSDNWSVANRQMVKLGHDGIIQEFPDGTKDLVVFSPNQIKSADPVTRDDQGRIIPLSRRFDTGTDIRGQINVTTPEGKRAGFVVVMPSKSISVPIALRSMAMSEPSKQPINQQKYDEALAAISDFLSGKQTIQFPGKLALSSNTGAGFIADDSRITQGLGEAARTTGGETGTGTAGGQPSDAQVQGVAQQGFGPYSVRNLVGEASRIGVADVRIDPESKHGAYTTVSESGEIYIGINPARMANRIAANDGDVQYAIGSILNEELIHAADMAVLKEQWLSSGSKLTLTEFVKEQDVKTVREMIQVAKSSNDPVASTRILFDAITSSVNLYAGNDVTSLDSVETFLNAASHDEISSVMGEFVRQMIQTGLYQTVSEKTLFRKFIEKVKALARKIADVFAPAKEGQYGKLIKERLNGIEELLAYASTKTGAKASRIKAEDATEAAKTFQADIIEAGKGRIDTDSYQGNTLKSTEAPDHNVNAPELYKDAAISLVDSLLKKHSITDIANSFQDPEFRVAVGLLGNKAINPNVAQQAELFTGAVIQKKLEKALNGESDPAKKRLIEKTLKNHKAYYTVATGIGQNLNAVGALQQDPDFKGMFLFNEAEKEMADKGKDKLDTITGGGTQPVTDMVNQSEEAAADEATKQIEESVEEDEYANLLNEGEEGLEGRRKTIWERAKMILRRLAMYARADKMDVKTGSKASLSAEQRKELDELNAILRMPKAERDKAREKDLAEFDDLMAEFLGLESDAKITEQKKTRAKRKKMVDTAKKRAEAGKSIDISDTESAVKIVLREMGKARPGKQVPLTKLMPWKDILAQKAKTVDEYRQRILDAMMVSDAFKEVSDEDKAKIADIFAKKWDKKRTDILDRMLEREIDRKRKEGSLSEAAAKALQKSRNKIIELANLGGFDNDDLMKVLGEKFGIKTGFSEAEKARISELADKLQDETLNPAKRNKLAMEFAVTLAGASEIPVAEIIANWWTSSVLFGPQTIFSIGAAFVNGAYSITTIGTRRMLADLTRGDVKGAIEESILMLQGIAKYLGAFKQAGRRAWSYLWTGNVDVLGAAANDILGEINSLEELKRFKRHKLLAENLAKDPRALRRYVGMYLRFVNRLLTSLDAFNVMVTKAGTASLALRMSGMSTENIIKAEKMLNLKAYKDQVIRDYFDNKAPTTQDGKALVDSYAEAEMYRTVDQLGGKMENADYLASESAMTMNPTGLGGFFYRSITGLDSKMKKAAEDYLEKTKKEWTTEKDLESALFLGLAYLRQFAVQNLGGVAGYKFIRFASNKFNQGISYLPMVGLLRTLEAKGDEIKGKEAFIETIHRNQVIGAVLTLAAIAVVKAIEEEPDDEKRGNFWNGGWQNLTPDQKKQMLAKGQKEYTMGFKFNGRWYVFNYQNWPLNQVLAAIGSMSDQIRFSPKQWEGKGSLSKSLAGIVSGLKSTLEIPALSQLGTLVGNRLASKDPTEQTVDRLSNVASGWVGGFVPRILKDLDFATQPEFRKYKTLWEKTASHIPIYRRYVGEDYYDILGQPIKRNVIPGSREFMMGPTEPEYKILGALNSRNIFLTPANAEYRMVGKGRNRRRLTQEEADAYSLETGKGYRQMLLRYGQRALQMPTERARAFLSDKADEVRDRALKKVYRGYK